VRAAQGRLLSLDPVNRDVAVFCFGFALLRLWAVLTRPPVRYPDSASYFDINFLGHAARLWTVPLLYRALPGDEARVVAQIAIGVLCWSALAFAVAKSLKHPLVARVGAILVLLLALCGQVAEWDQIILSESLSLSITALLFAAVLWLRLERSTRAVVGVLTVLVLWIFARELHAVLFIPVALVAVAWIVLRARRYLLVALAIAAIGAWGGYAAAQASANIRFNAYNLLVLRLLQQPGGATFFRQAKMPDLARLANESAQIQTQGVSAYLGNKSPTFRDPAWGAWIDRHWKLTYAEWLLDHPVRDITGPSSQLNELLSGFPNYGSARAVLPAPIQDALWERSSGDLPFWIVLTAVIWLVSLRRGRPGTLDALAAVGVAFSLLWYLASWHGDAAELPRHMIPIAASLRIALMTLSLAALDRSARRR
jgi:hypothetical protein